MPKPTQARVSPTVFRPGPLPPVPSTVYKETPGPVPADGECEMSLCTRAMKPSKRTRPLSQKSQQRISIATTMAYSRFRRECLAYHHSLANYLMLMDWIDDRRIEMLAEGRRYWVPSVRDFEQARRDCWDDLAKE